MAERERAKGARIQESERTLIGTDPSGLRLRLHLGFVLFRATSYPYALPRPVFTRSAEMSSNELPLPPYPVDCICSLYTVVRTTVRKLEINYLSSL